MKVLLQKLSGEHDGRDVPFLLSLGGHSKEAGDTGDLSQDVSFFHATPLSFPDPVHHLVARASFATRSRTKRSPSLA